jgi:hypothetical protein
MTTILLWAIALLYSFHFAGHLHNMLTNVPNWSSGSIEDMNRYGTFYHKVTNARFFARVIFATILACILSLFYVWNQSDFVRNMVAADLVIVVLVLIGVFTVFRPMNNYFLQKQYEDVRLKEMVGKWVAYNYIRMVVILLGLILSIWNLASFQFAG